MFNYIESSSLVTAKKVQLTASCKKHRKMNTYSLVYFVIVVFTESISAHYISNPCSSSGHTNGCSIPGGLQYLYKDVFEPACDKHNICYECGHKYHISRRTCDKQFWSDLLNATCVGSQLFCKTVPHKYYIAVRIGGRSRYVTSSPEWCNQRWVSYCLNA